MERPELAARLAVAVAAGGVGQEVPFQRRFVEAVAGSAPVLLDDPAWGERERTQFEAIVAAPAPADAAGPTGVGWLAVPTGGSSGRLKLARHDGATLHAAVRGFAAHFGVGRVHALGVLPLHHVSGLMAWLRCALTGGRFVAADWAAIAAGARPAPPDADGEAFLSLVPTQLARLLALEDRAARASAVAWLRRFRAVFVGGGPAWAELLDRAAEARVPVALSYGMTETAAMVAAQRPEEFLAGDRSAGTVLPHARVSTDAAGRLVIEAESLFRGYWPEARAAGALVTDDLGEIDAAGRVHVRGRRDALIISGGEKVDPQEVEAALRATGEFADVVVLGVPDTRWGEAVVACFPAAAANVSIAAAPDLGRVRAALSATLAPAKHPKAFVPVSPWPRSAQGKIDRALLRATAAAALAGGTAHRG